VQTRPPLRDVKSAIVFGGSQGIGAAIAHRLAVGRADVFLASRNGGNVKAAVERLGGLPGRVGGTTGDVTDATSVAVVVEKAIREMGPPDTIINCAGLTLPGYFDETPVEHFEEQLQLNFLGSLHIIKTAVPVLRERGGGKMMMTASLAGLVGLFGYSAYAASKFATVGLCLSLRPELKAHGISLSVLCPAAVDTPGFAAENRIKPPVLLEMEKRAGVADADRVADAALRGMQRGKALILPTWQARVIHTVYRFLPSIYETLTAPPLKYHP